MTSRRALFKGALALGALGAAGGVSALLAREELAAFQLSRRLDGMFPGLRFEEGLTSVFARDWNQHKGWKSSIRVKDMDLTTYFLLSTDFFHKGADTERTIKYLRFYDPHHVGCVNPLARFG